MTVVAIRSFIRMLIKATYANLKCNHKIMKATSENLLNGFLLENTTTGNFQLLPRL